jgi:molybdopterin molybdotransferase
MSQNPRSSETCREAAPFFDVRMRGFRDRADVEVVLKLLSARISSLPPESILLQDADRRVLAEDIMALTDVPAFDRAAMDGYALRADETYGAGTYNPLEFGLIGESFPGRPYPGIVSPGQAVRIMTGAPIPKGADAVVQAEAAEVHEGRLRVIEPISPGRNVGRRGEDIRAGAMVLQTGRVLRPQDLGVLASIGNSSVNVFPRPTVSILITGDELLPCGSRPEGFRIVDSNSIMLNSLVRRDGGSPVAVQLVPDSRDAIEAALLQAGGDAILVSGGSSVGQEDHAPRVLAEQGELSVHGMALRPASPAGIGFLRGRPVFLLPGNPVSCLCAYDFFAGAAIRRLGGRSMEWPYRSRYLRLARKIVSAVGRVDYVRVQILDGKVEPMAISGASILSSTTRADGFVIVARDSEGFAAGEEIEVFFYDA